MSQLIENIKQIHEELNIKPGDVINTDSNAAAWLHILSTIRLKYCPPCIVEGEGNLYYLLYALGLQGIKIMKENGYPYGHMCPKEADNDKIFKDIQEEINTLSEKYKDHEFLKQYLPTINIAMSLIAEDIQAQNNAIKEYCKLSSSNALYIPDHISADERKYGICINAPKKSLLDANTGKQMLKLFFMSGIYADSMYKHHLSQKTSKSEIEMIVEFVDNFDLACWKGMLKHLIPLFPKTKTSVNEIIEADKKLAQYDYSNTEYYTGRTSQDSDDLSTEPDPALKKLKAIMADIEEGVDEHMLLIASRAGMTNPEGNLFGVIKAGSIMKNVFMLQLSNKILELNKVEAEQKKAEEDEIIDEWSEAPSELNTDPTDATKIEDVIKPLIKNQEHNLKHNGLKADSLFAQNHTSLYYIFMLTGLCSFTLVGALILKAWLLKSQKDNIKNNSGYREVTV